MALDTQGFVPGGENRVQWIFEGEWTDEEMQPCIDLLTDHITAYRERLGFDMIAWFRFSFVPFNNDASEIDRLWFVTRRGWGYSHMGTTLEEMLEKLKKDLADRIPQ